MLYRYFVTDMHTLNFRQYMFLCYKHDIYDPERLKALYMCL